MTNTFRAAGTTGWEIAVDGANYSRFGIQIISSQPAHVCIAAAAPAVNTQDYMVLSTGLTKEFTASLLAGDKVYIRTETPVAVAVRGFREAR